jgi:hypothetical protein
MNEDKIELIIEIDSTRKEAGEGATTAKSITCRRWTDKDMMEFAEYANGAQGGDLAQLFINWKESYENNKD